MSKDTILDDAIAKAKESEDWQLVEWLRMARGSESAARWYSDKLRDAHRVERKLLNENAKLRELCADIYKRFHGVVFECWAYSSEDFRMYEHRMRELGIEVDG